jgi:hypothetical protein
LDAFVGTCGALCPSGRRKQAEQIAVEPIPDHRFQRLAISWIKGKLGKITKKGRAIVVSYFVNGMLQQIAWAMSP